MAYFTYAERKIIGYTKRNSGGVPANFKNYFVLYFDKDFSAAYTWKDGKWSEGVLTQDESVTMHMGATCLHYGQECFEGLKVFEQKSGDLAAFRIDENAKRLVRSCEKIYMAPVPEAFTSTALRKPGRAFWYSLLR